jgi:hypothetical protein
MKVEVKNWLGVVILLGLGFVLDNMIDLFHTKANSQGLTVGRYQLVAGTYKNGYNDEKIPAVFRIDTVTGVVEEWCFSFEEIPITEAREPHWFQNWMKLEERAP